MRSNAFSLTAPTAAAGDRSGNIVSHLQRTDVFRDYQQAFEATTGLPLVLRQAGSYQPPLHGSNRLNPFCALMARSNGSCAACLRLQQRVEEGATRKPMTLECFAGLSESAVPVQVGAKLIGYLQTGQVFLRPATARRFERVMGMMPGPKTASEMREFEAAYFGTRVVAKGQYDSVIRLLAIFAQHLAWVSNQIRVREASGELPAMTKARAFIAEHQSEEIHLRDVARAANTTKCYFCKLFKSTTGLTFTNYLTRVRIESVKQMLLNVHMRVSEAAYAAGFQSLSQFNRAFRRVAGESPSEFRRGLSTAARSPACNGTSHGPRGREDAPQG
jgi:AraC-like DNA-binding protein/ligand-binding sensor protein